MIRTLTSNNLLNPGSFDLSLQPRSRTNYKMQSIQFDRFTKGEALCESCSAWYKYICNVVSTRRALTQTLQIHDQNPSIMGTRALGCNNFTRVTVKIINAVLETPIFPTLDPHYKPTFYVLQTSLNTKIITFFDNYTITTSYRKVSHFLNWSILRSLGFVTNSTTACKPSHSFF